MAGQMICIKYPYSVGQKCVQQSRSYFYDVEPNKKKMIQDLPVKDHIKIALLLIDELTEDKNKAEVKALKTKIEELTAAKNNAESELLQSREALSKIEDLTAAKNKAESELLQAREALSKPEELIEANKIAKPEVLEALHSNKEEENIASKQADRAQHHSKVDQLVNINIVQGMLEGFEWLYLNNRCWQDSLQDPKFVYSLKEAGVSRPYGAEDIAKLLNDNFVQQMEDVARDLRFESGDVLKLYNNFETEDQKKLLSFVAKKFNKTIIFVENN